MKRILSKLEVGIGKTAYQVVKKNVNSTCIYSIYQPKLPKGAEKLRK